VPQLTSYHAVRRQTGHTLECILQRVRHDDFAPCNLKWWTGRRSGWLNYIADLISTMTTRTVAARFLAAPVQSWSGCSRTFSSHETLDLQAW